jgi:hypothetical protein
MPVHMTGSFLPPQHEEVDVGDAVFLQQKGVTIEAAVVKKQGRRIKLLPEDRSGEMWVAPEQCDKVVTGGAEELMSRAAREAERAAREEAARQAEAARVAAEAAEKDGYNQKQKERVDTLTRALNARAVPSRDWCPIGKYCWTESPILMDQTKDCYRIVWYEIDVEKDYGGKHAPPEIDLSEVDELIAAVEQREKDKKEAEKEAAKKKKGKPKKPTEEEIAALEAAKAAEAEADQKEQDAAKKRAQDKLDKELKTFEKVEALRKPVKPPKYPPDLPPILEPPQHPKNQKLFDDLTGQGHAGDRIFYTDGSWHSLPYVEGSKDGVLKGGGLARDVVEQLGFMEKVVTFKAGYDGGITLTKHDCFPEEDPSNWITKDEEKWYGEFREDQEGQGTEEW